MAKRKLDEKSINKIKDLYLNKNYSATEISKVFNVSAATICSYLKSENINVVNKQNILKIDKATGDLIIDRYLNKSESLSKLSKDLKISIATISKFLKKNNVDVINYHNIAKFDENIFDNIDSEDKAYWLGFIFADGNISSSRNTFEITLSYKDKKHLDKFNTFTKFKGDNVLVSDAKYNGKIYKRCRWSIVNKHLWETLNNYGCIPNKSLVLEFPNCIPKEYLRDFIRGYFDGDGCITYDHLNITPLSNMLGTEKFLYRVKEILSELNINSNITSDKRMKDTKILNIKKSDVNDFLDYLYKDSKIYLDRKFNRYEFFKHSRSAEELAELLASENGEGCDANTVIT